MRVRLGTNYGLRVPATSRV
ncbi:hypothetical protein MTR67_044403 [Solanum verrucosum]|uniref:Uncharacterized protein n=1 Tax=Solanum verrucosum TaxID=315347 RepID=A0AAF0ZV90_SOLVR|nr:hypothetical protein MTR67_044403 [Solanum verrucosum]